jgi:hypothetical protein
VLRWLVNQQVRKTSRDSTQFSAASPFYPDFQMASSERLHTKEGISSISGQRQHNARLTL